MPLSFLALLETVVLSFSPFSTVPQPAPSSATPSATRWSSAPTSAADLAVADPDDAGEPAPTATVANVSADWMPSRYLADTGPLRVRDQFALGLGFLAFDPVSAELLTPGQWQVDFILTLANDFVHAKPVEDRLSARPGRRPVTLEELRAIEAEPTSDGIFYLDGEHTRTAFAIRRGLTDRVQLEINLPILLFQGGFLDRAIESFHDAFSLGQAGRLGVDRSDFTSYVRSDDLEVYSSNDPGFQLGDVVIGAKIDLDVGAGEDDDPRWESAVEVLVKAPTGDRSTLTSSGSVDLGVQFLITRYFARGCLHGAVGALALGEFKALGIDDQLVLSGVLAFERAIGDHMATLLQLTMSQSPFQDLGIRELDAATFQLTWGIKKVIGKRDVLFLGITENLGSFNNTPDIGLHFGMTRTVG